MKIGIIVFSRTGHTLSVAEKLRDALAAAGHEIRLEQITVETINPGKGGNVRFTNVPTVDEYEGLVFASPVEAFSLAQPMELYLRQMDSLKGKKVGFFVTRHLTQKWLGGNRSIARMENACREKGAEIGKSGMISWKDEALRARQTEETVALLAGMF